MIDITQYHVPAPMLSRTYRLAFISDLHNCRWEKTADAIVCEQPDAVVIAGDLMENIDDGGDRALAFLREITPQFPVFCSLAGAPSFERTLSAFLPSVTVVPLYFTAKMFSLSLENIPRQ